MPVKPSHKIPVLAALAAAAFALSACGRLGQLEPPPDATAQAKPAPPKGDQVAALGSQIKPKIPPITPPNQPFFLDFLVK